MRPRASVHLPPTHSPFRVGAHSCDHLVSDSHEPISPRPHLNGRSARPSHHSRTRRFTGAYGQLGLAGRLHSGARVGRPRANKRRRDARRRHMCDRRRCRYARVHAAKFGQTRTAGRLAQRAWVQRSILRRRCGAIRDWLCLSCPPRHPRPAAVQPFDQLRRDRVVRHVEWSARGANGVGRALGRTALRRPPADQPSCICLRASHG